MTRRNHAITLGSVLLALALALAAVPALAGARDELAAFTKNLKTLDGQFTQQVYDSNGHLKETSSGRVALSAPRLFHWEYAKPYEQLIIADGKTVWVYDPDLQQVTRRAQGSQEQDSPLAALVDPSRLDRDYIVSEAGMAEGKEWLMLKPKQADAGNSAFESARLGFDANGLASMQVIDSLGQKTVIEFSSWKRNPSLAADTFRFTPPKGVDVIGGES